MKPKNKNAVRCTEVPNPPMSYFRNGSPVEFKIIINSTPNVTGTYYGEVGYFNPSFSIQTIIWFSYNYVTVSEAFEDCWKKQQEFIRENPVIK